MVAPKGRPGAQRAGGGTQQTAIMENDVIAMEQRLAQLKATMTEERARRSEAQQANPSGYRDPR